MRFEESTKLAQVLRIEFDRFEDERGFFGRTYLKNEFAAHGIESAICERNISYNKKRATTRGLHLQHAPHGQEKLVTCIKGSIFDVVVDVRPDSANYLKFETFELSEDSYAALFIPKGFAHGFQTLVDDTIVSYEMFQAYMPEAGVGFRWDDPAIGIDWPMNKDITISARDTEFPLIK